MADTVKKNLNCKVKMTLRSFLMKYAKALMLPTGQASPDKTRPGAQTLLAREQLENQEHKRKLPEKTIKDQLLRQDKNLNNILFCMDQLAKDTYSQANFTTGNARGKGQGGGRGMEDIVSLTSISRFKTIKDRRRT
jgi:hypothetical protein